jgi:hypothetical protein
VIAELLLEYGADLNAVGTPHDVRYLLILIYVIRRRQGLDSTALCSKWGVLRRSEVVT